MDQRSLAGRTGDTCEPRPDTSVIRKGAGRRPHWQKQAQVTVGTGPSEGTGLTATAQEKTPALAEGPSLKR